MTGEFVGSCAFSTMLKRRIGIDYDGVALAVLLHSE